METKMKKVERKIIHLFSFFIFSLFIYSCDDPFVIEFDDPLAINPPPGMGAVTLVIGEVDARTVKPVDGLSHFQAYKLEFKDSVSDAVIKTEYRTDDYGDPVYLSAGTYWLDVTAYADESRTKIAAITDLTEITIFEIKAGVTISVPVKLKTKTTAAGDFGTFSWNITLPDGLNVATMKIQRYSDSFDLQTINLLGDPPGNNGSLPLTPDHYRLFFTLQESNRQEVVIRDILHIYPNLESKSTRVFTDAHLNNIRYTVILDFRNGEGTDFVTGVHGHPIDPFGAPTVVPSFTPVAGLYLGDPNKKLFDGWCIEGSDVKWDFTSDVVTGYMTLYANWISPAINVPADTAGANSFEKAIAYVNTPANAGEGAYTLFVDSDVLSVAPQTINTANFNLTIQGLGQERTIQLSNTANTLFTINNTSASLTLGKDITLQGKMSGETNLVYVTNGTFTMEDDSKITGHKAGSGTVFIQGGTFNMNGGEISGNTATNGAGVYMAYGTFNMGGNAKVSGNTVASNNNGGGVFVNGGTITIGGSAVISGNTTINSETANNLYLANGIYITLGDGTLTTGYVPAPTQYMNIGVKTATASGIIVSGGVTDAAIADYFHADEEGYKVLLSDISLTDTSLVISDFYAQVAAYGTASSNKIINVPNLILPGNVTVPGNLNGATLTITSSSGVKTLTRGAADSETDSGLFIVSNNAKLVFEDIVIDGDKDIHTTNTMPLVRVKASGTFTLNSGAVLKNNLATNGGGVYIAGGTFNLSGGEISGNIAGPTGTSSGGGVYVGSGTFNFTSGTVLGNVATSGGGGVFMSGGEFNMSGGTIGGTGTAANSAQRGGGVSIAGGTFIMNGGTIGGAGKENRATVSGGGVYMSGGTFNMSSDTSIPTVSGNKVTGNGGGVCVTGATFNMGNNACVADNEATGDGGGGGVYVSNNNGKFNMSGGSIIDNTAVYGGGVYTYLYGMFAMTGGMVSGNKTTFTNLPSGGGVYVGYNGIFNISNGTVYGNESEIDADLKNNADQGAALGISSNSAGTQQAQRGTFNGTSWSNLVNLDTTNNTIRVGNGVLIDAAFTSPTDFSTWLATRGANTAATPYTVKLDVSNLGGDSSANGSVGNALNTNNSKYVNLDLSGSTFTATGVSAFVGCSGLTGITLPASGLTNIGVNAFDGCTNLADITIPATVTYIGNSSFQDCNALTGITIPASVTQIGDDAFRPCPGLTSVTFATGSNISGLFGNNAFHEGSGNGTGSNTLRTAYLAANPKSGTYTRDSGGSVWAKQP